MKRKSGFYWAISSIEKGTPSPCGINKWHIAYYESKGKDWLICGSDEYFVDEDFKEINETKIK